MTQLQEAEKSYDGGPFNVVTWNILLDKTKSALLPDDPQYVVPQLDRVPRLAQTLGDLPVSLDVVGLCEVHLDSGEEIARSLGMAAGYWFQHNQPQPKQLLQRKKGRKGEKIGLFGNYIVEAPEVLDLGDNRSAVIAYVGGIAVAELHLRSELWGKQRERQMAILLERLKSEDKAVIMGDFNALWFEKVRRNVRRADFEPVFEMVGRQTPVTHPAPGYEDLVMRKYLSVFEQIPRNLDQIYVKGVGAIAAGRFSGDSDHYGLWATIDPSL